MPILSPIELVDPGAHARLAELWGAACGPALALNARAVAFAVAPAPDIAQAGVLAVEDGTAAGFVLASAASAAGIAGGWVDAIAVRPEHRRRGVGTALLGWAEAWLAAHGAATAHLGGSLRPFVPGLPAELDTQPFFERRGYVPSGDVWDVASDLGAYRTPQGVGIGAAEVEPASAGTSEALLAFLGRAFPGRWAWEGAEHLRCGGRPQEFLLLWVDGQVEGFCQLTTEDSLRSIARFFPGALPRPWGQLGPIGVSRAVRGRGLGAALLDAGLRQLQGRGVRGCVIDWTNLLDFYGKFGFAPFRRYTALSKRGGLQGGPALPEKKFLA